MLCGLTTRTPRLNDERVPLYVWFPRSGPLTRLIDVTVISLSWLAFHSNHVLLFRGRYGPRRIVALNLLSLAQRERPKCRRTCSPGRRTCSLRDTCGLAMMSFVINILVLLSSNRQASLDSQTLRKDPMIEHLH